jgi:hypothetical protein
MALSNREGAPLHSVAETSVFVSTSSFTLGAFGPDFVDDALDLFHAHRFARQRTKVPCHLKKTTLVAISCHLPRDQLAELGGIKQPSSSRFGGDFFWQIEFYCDAHGNARPNALAAETKHWL